MSTSAFGFRPKFLRGVAAMMVASMVVGCAANGRGLARGDDECSAVKSAGAGALIGGLLGAAIDGKEGARKGAVAGGLVGGLGCLAMNYRSKQVRSAAQVNKEYQNKHKSLPPAPVVTAYTLQAPKQVVRGNPVSVNSSLTLVDGATENIQQVEERLFIVDAEGKRKQIKSKEAQNTGMNAGEYSNSFSFTPPAGVAQGNYRLESELYVNNKLAKTAKAPMTLAYDANGTIIVTLKS